MCDEKEVVVPLLQWGNVEIKEKSMAERLFGPTFSIIVWKQPLEPVLGQFENAIKTDNVEQLDRLIITTDAQTYRLIVHDVWQIAVKHGQLDMLNLLYDRTPSLQLPGSQILIPAVKSGSIEVLCWLREKSQTCISDFGVMHEAICAGRVEVVAWLIQQSSDNSWWRQGYFCLDCPMDNLAVSKGHVHLASWLFRKFYWISREACETIVRQQFDKFQNFVGQHAVLALGVAESAIQQLRKLDILERIFNNFSQHQRRMIALHLMQTAMNHKASYAVPFLHKMSLFPTPEDCESSPCWRIVCMAHDAPFQDVQDVLEVLSSTCETCRQLIQKTKKYAEARIELELHKFDKAKQLTCVVCMDRSITCRLDPCGHVSVCQTCLDQFPEPKQCPICREQIQKAQQCFFPA